MWSSDPQAQLYSSTLMPITHFSVWVQFLFRWSSENNKLNGSFLTLWVVIEKLMSMTLRMVRYTSAFQSTLIYSQFSLASFSTMGSELRTLNNPADMESFISFLLIIINRYHLTFAQFKSRFVANHTESLHTQSSVPEDVFTGPVPYFLQRDPSGGPHLLRENNPCSHSADTYRELF